jgi:AcrR family transcriptional regulator
MNDRSQHRERILGAAEKLFSTRGYHGTSLREIADGAGVSLGNIYNHFEDKERLFETLMEELEERYLAPTEPIPRALAKLDFPDGLEALGEAARETVKRFASYIRLIYVDVTEFEGKHLGRLYGGMKDRFRAIFGEKFKKLERDGRIGDVDPLVAIMLVNITYMHYFTVEHLFGVRKHYGLDDAKVIREFARVFRNGILKR